MKDDHIICLDTDIARAKAKRWIDAAPDGWCVTFTEETRSLIQNAKIHAMITDIAKHFGWMYAGQKRKLLCWKRVMVNQFYQEINVSSELVPSWDGQRVVIVNDTTSDMGKKRMAQFVEYLYALGAELKVRWSEPALKAYEELRRAA
jgi:hypothetical protein